jgi:hypothetical protein
MSHPRRGHEFVTRKITTGIARILAGWTSASLDYRDHVISDPRFFRPKA